MRIREDEKTETSIPDSSAYSNEERREFLKKCGRFAAYTTPVVIALLCYDEKTAHAATSNPTNQ
jgi:hypothetical protein